jgi:hypothetical protein
MWRNVGEVKVINDSQVVCRLKDPATTLPYALSRRDGLRIVRKVQWDKEGIEDLARSMSWQDHPRRPDKGRAASGERAQSYGLMRSPMRTEPNTE